MITKKNKIYYSYEIQCDVCGVLYKEPYDVDVETEDYMPQGTSMISKFARMAGWRIKDDKHTCSDCLSIESEGIWTV